MPHDKLNPGVSKWRPTTVFSVARGSIHENLQIWIILQLITVNVSAEANLKQDLL